MRAVTEISRNLARTRTDYFAADLNNSIQKMSDKRPIVSHVAHVCSCVHLRKVRLKVQSNTIVQRAVTEIKKYFSIVTIK